MTGHRHLKILVIIFASGLSIGCGVARNTDTWEVLLGAIPKSISVKDAEQTITYYILRQTHEPLFRQDDGSSYQSKLLTRWSRNISSSEYLFCPDTSRVFDKDTAFNADFFYKYLWNVTGKYNLNFKLLKQDGCVTLKFDKPQPHLLAFLSRYENAPTVSKSAEVENGLGPFYVQSLSQKEAILLRKKRIPNGYNKIIIHAYSGPDDPNLENRNIADFNRISSYSQPEWIKNEYIGFNNLELKSVNIIINHTDREMRRILYNCIDVGEFREAFAPQRKEFHDIQTLLPIGFFGSKPGKTFQKCQFPKGMFLKTAPSLVLLNQQKDNNQRLQVFIDGLYRKTGIKILVLQPSGQKIVEMLHRRPHGYNLAVVVMGTQNWDYGTVFKYYAGDSAYYDYVPKDVSNIYKKLVAATMDEMPALAVQLADELVKQSMVLTLYQTSVKLYYPKLIKNFVIGRGFLETPEVGDFRW